MALSTAGMVLAWTALRGVLDPTPTGAAVVIGGALVGSTIGRWLAPSRPAAGLVWALCLLMMLLGLVGAGSLLTDRIGSAAAAWAWGLEGRLWLALPLALVGLCGGMAMGRAPRADKASCWGVGIGLLIGPWALGSGAGVIGLGVMGSLAALSLARPSVRAVGAAVAISSVVLTTSDWVPNPSRMGPGIYDEMRSTDQWSAALSQRKQARWHAWVPGGTAALIPDEAAAPEGARQPVQIELDGLNIQAPSRAAAAEELAGHLAALLSPDPTGIVVLGDSTGEVVRGIDAHPTAAVQVAVPYPGLLQTLAKTDPIRRGTWLDPHVQTQRTTPQRRLWSTLQAPAIIELSRTPWTSGEAPGITAAHLDAVRNRLGPDGIYLLCTHLGWWPDGGPAALARQLASTFEYVQVWLPPEGADSLVWVASEAPISLQRLTERYENATGPLARLGYSGATGLAGTAIAGSSGIAHWGAGAPPLPSADHLGPSLFAKPVFHAAGLAGLESTAVDIWDTSNSSADLAEIDEVLGARRMFLALIDDATRGQIGAAFDTARALLETHGEIGAKTLEPLIDRHIKDAQAAIRLGVAEGPTSDAWAEAQRFATTARMIAPQSARPHVMLAEVALGRGDVQRAEGHFRTALRRDPTHIGALDGLARCGRLRGEDGQVEQALRSATRHAPRDWRTWHNLGIYLLEKGRLEEALEALRDAAALAPKDEPSPLIGMAKVYLAKDEAPGALVRAQRAIQLDKDSGIAWYLRGRAHFALERYDEAEHDFRSAILADRSLIEARGAIGQVRAIRGDYAAAAEQFKAVLTVDPSNVPARENLRRLAPLLPQGLDAQP
jgi:tetratricopeptide (TPR) repeat protein